MECLCGCAKRRRRGEACCSPCHVVVAGMEESEGVGRRLSVGEDGELPRDQSSSKRVPGCFHSVCPRERVVWCGVVW